MSRRFLLLTAPLIVAVACMLTPATGMAASNIKWFTLAAGVDSLLAAGTYNVADVGDSLSLTAQGGSLTLTCLVFGGGTITNPVLPSPGGNGSGQDTTFSAISAPCPAAGALGTGCTASVTALNWVSPPFTGRFPWLWILIKIIKLLKQLKNATMGVSFSGSCLASGTTSAFAAPTLNLALTNLVSPPHNGSKECSGTIPNTVRATLDSTSGTLMGTQGSTGTAAVSGTVEIWKVPNTVTLTSAAQVCTGLDVLLTTG